MVMLQVVCLTPVREQGECLLMQALMLRVIEPATDARWVW